MPPLVFGVIGALFIIIAFWLDRGGEKKYYWVKWFLVINGVLSLFQPLLIIFNQEINKYLPDLRYFLPDLLRSFSNIALVSLAFCILMSFFRRN